MIQYPIKHVSCPILPPNQFRHIQTCLDFKVSNSNIARSLYQEYSGYSKNKFNKRKYVDGALYSSLFPECCHVIDPIPGGVIELLVKIKNTNEISSVLITYDIDKLYISHIPL